MKMQTWAESCPLPKLYPPLARDKVLARMNSYNSCWKISINYWRKNNGFAITPWHESGYNEAELCRRLHCTEEEARLLISSNPVIFSGCYFFILTFAILMPLCMNQVNGVLVRKKDGDSCTLNLDGHCCYVQTSTNIMRVLGMWDIHYSQKAKSSIGRMMEERWQWSHGTTWLTLLCFWWKWMRKFSTLLGYGQRIC